MCWSVCKKAVKMFAVNLKKIKTFVATLCIFIPGTVALSFAQDNPKAATSQGQTVAGQQETSETLLMNALHFRHIAAHDMAIAMKKSASPSGLKALQELTSQTWSSPVRKLGWAHFWAESLLVLGDIQENSALSVFYHPWSDVFLVLRWAWGAGQWKIDDADWVTGDWMRNVGQGPIDFKPLWLRGDFKRGDSLALEIAQSIRVVEEMFVNQYPAAEWREMLNLQTTTPGTLINRQAAAVQLNMVLMNQASFNAPDVQKQATLQPVRASLTKLVQALQAGRMTDVLAQARKTESLQRQVLSKIDGAALQDLFPVFYLPASSEKNSHAVVFLLSEHHMDFSIAVHFSAKGNQIEALELIPFAAVVEAGAEVNGG